MTLVSWQFFPLTSPSFVTLDYADQAGLIHPVEVEEGAIIRVRYSATREQDAMIDKDAIRRELLAAGASRVTIEPQITREIRARVETLTQDLSEEAALALYVEAQGLSPDMGVRMSERLRDWMAS